MPREIHQMLPTLSYGDAVGNQVLEIRRLLRKWGYSSEIFAERWQSRLTQECKFFDSYKCFSHPDNLLILHYSIGSEVNHFALTLPDQIIIYYHNITPAHFFHGVNDELFRLLDEGRRGLASFSSRVPAIAASPYNRQELEKMGFNVLGVVPYILNLKRLDQGGKSEVAKKIRRQYERFDSTDWLYVGRLAPNKCIQDIIKAFYFFHTKITSSSRLLLVGTGEGIESYTDGLHRLVTRLKLEDAVVFVGHYGAEEGLASFYQMASIYVCMSEHEGFCIPLVEAMYYNIPVIAYASTGVPAAMGKAGILVREKNYIEIAELIDVIISNKQIRETIIKTQLKRLADYKKEKIAAKLMEYIEKVTKVEGDKVIQSTSLREMLSNN